MNSIVLGTKVKDSVTGFEGIADNRTEWLFGCDRICVQPLMKEDGTVPDSRMIDEPQLVVLDGTPVSKVSGTATKKVLLGNIVKDVLTGTEGTATGRATYLNGCYRVYLEPIKKFSKDIQPYWVDEGQLEDTNKSLIKGNKGATEESKKTGGPARANSFR